MIERELIANWNSVMYPDPEPEASMQEPYGMEQVEQFQVAQAPSDEQPGFGGVSPRQFARGALDTGAAVVKGATQGFLGLPGDLEEIGRLLINLVGGDLDEEAYLATTDDIKKMLDQFAPLNARMGEREQKVSETVGELAAPGGYVKGAKNVIKGLKKGAEAVAPVAGEMIERSLTRTGAILKAAPDAKGIQIPSAGNVARPEFKKWFGESKIVDPSGQPLVMYHGTTRSFESFDPNVTRPELDDENIGAIFFTSNPKFAGDFAGDISITGPGGNIVPVYVKADKPFDYENPEHRKLLIDTVLQKYGQKRPDGKMALFENGKPTLYDKEVLDAGLDPENTSNWMLMENKQVQETIKSLGFDSFFVKEAGNKNLAVYKPEQVKSVFNKGTWNPNDPRIVNSLGAGGSAIGAGAVTMPQTQQEPK